MAIPTVQITGSVVRPDGVGVSSGRITARLSQPGSALDGATSQRVGAAAVVDLGANGAVPAGLKLVPNDVITPSGTAYFVTFAVTLADGSPAQWTEQWQLASTPNPIDIGAILRVSTGGVTFLAGPVGPTGPSFYEAILSWIGRPIASEVLARFVIATAFTIPAGCAGSQAKVGTNPTATATVTFRKNGVDVGSVAFATNGTPTFTAASPISLAAGDLLSFHAQATADATLADVSVTLRGAP